ncbi:ABCD4 (predicted) [Pycnogonum litorale]
MGLYYRAGGLDEEVDWNWYDVLSPSEAHRLCFIRMFYHRPKVGLLDDVLGTIDHAIIDFIFRECDSLGITLVTIGDEEMLGKYHRQILRLNIDGTWTLKE